MDIKDYLNKQWGRIEKHLDSLVPEKNVPYNVLFQAARYALLGGGKRLRPILTLATTETLNGNIDIALSPACALEMVHAYSLIHDDLPCMDDDDFRRGKPTVHKIFSEGKAVLSGDYLLTEAFAVLAKAPGLSAEQRLSLIEILAKSSGGDGMIGGQVMDVEAEKQEVDLELMRWVHRCKTGALITASVLFGGVVSGASDKEMKILKEFGDYIGLAFQVMDDILDVTASEAKHGRAVASDVINGKATYVTLLGLEKAKATAESLQEDAIKTLSGLSYDTRLLESLADYIINRSV